MNGETEPMVRLTARDITMEYGFRAVLRGISLDVVAGQPLAITGTNGAGKSTLVKILAGVLTPTGGSVEMRVGGALVPDGDRAHRLGLVSQDLALYPPLTARETLVFIAKVRGLPAALDVVGVLSRVGLAGREDDRVSTFSTGMRQRLRIATALLHDPPVLLLDEPGATLDEDGRDLVASLVKERHRAVILATNDPAEADLCDDQIRVGD